MAARRGRRAMEPRGCVRSGSGIAHGGLLASKTPAVTRINNSHLRINGFIVAYLRVYTIIHGFVLNKYFVKCNKNK